MALSDLKTLMNASAQNLSQFKGLSAAYGILLGGTPSIDGYTNLINTNNSTNFGAGASGPTFNDENIYINTINALYQGNATAKSAFDAIVASAATIQDALTLVYNYVIPAASRTQAGLDYFKSQASFYASRAAELGVAGTNGTALVAFASLTKIAVDNDIGGLGDTINDLKAAVDNGTAAIPQGGDAFTPLETADGTQFDPDDVGGGSNQGQTFTLTTGVDTGAAYTGGTGNDTFTAADIAGVAAWTTGDSIEGGAGTDTFNIISNAAIAGAPVAAKVSGIETINATSGGAITLNTTTFTGLTALNATTSGAAQTLTAAATTDVMAIAGAQAATAVAVNGGKNVTVTATGAAAGTINVGATTAAAGTVTVTSTTAAADTTIGSAITVKGGTAINVTQKSSNAVNTTTTDGAVVVTGDANTKSVTVTSDKAATKSATVVGHVNGAVTITDVNAADATKAGAIDTVTVTGGAAVTVNSGALKTLNLGSTITSVDASVLGALTTPANATLALNLNEVTTTGAVTIDTDITTLNVNGTGKASTVNTLAAGGATKINVAGDAKVTFTNNTTAAVTDIVVTNTAGASFGTAIAAGVNFTGGDGADGVVLSTGFTKAITMGKGDDSVTYGGPAGTGGSVDAGEGTDTIVMTTAQADAADANSTFNTKFKNFEALKVSDALITAIDLDGLNAVTKVVLAAGATAGTINNLVSGGTVQLDADNAGALAINVKSALVSASDVLNIALNKSGGVLAGNTITAANIETINISAPDAAAAGSAAAINTMALAAGAATKIMVTGNNGLNLNATGSTAVTTFDASGVVGNGTADTAALLAVTYTSVNTKGNAAVSITGGAGNDTLTGNAGIDTITGGAGNDILKGAANADIINVGTGRDAVLFDSFKTVSVDSGTALTDTVNGFVLGSAFTTATDISTVANFQAAAATIGGANATVLGLDLDTDGVGTDQAITVKANGTAAGQAAGVTYTVTKGILTVSGAGASAVDTLGEWLTEAAAVASADGDILAFQFGSDTYVFAQNGAQDLLVKLAGVTGATGLVEGGVASTGTDNTIWYTDIT